MSEFIEKKCPKCGQELRFPTNIGGMLMACPSCGKTFHSDFKLGETNKVVHKSKRVNKGILTTVFEFPYKAMSRITRQLFLK